MLLEGPCQGLGAARAARKDGHGKQRCRQLLAASLQGAAAALENHKRGPKTNCRRRHEVPRQVVRYRCLARCSARCLAAKRNRRNLRKRSPSSCGRAGLAGLPPRCPIALKTAPPSRFTKGPKVAGPPHNHRYRSFPSPCQRDELEQLREHYPDRWHAEEFCSACQAMGWNRGGALHPHLRHARLTLALAAQAGPRQWRQRLGEPQQHGASGHWGEHLFPGLDGDVRVVDDTIVVTFYNAPNPQRLRQHYEHLPAQPRRQRVDPRAPWLYDFQLDFRFK